VVAETLPRPEKLKKHVQRIFTGEKEIMAAVGEREVGEFSEDLTVRVEKSNGENDLRCGEVRIKR
jgi:hypothetical protein